MREGDSIGSGGEVDGVGGDGADGVSESTGRREVDGGDSAGASDEVAGNVERAGVNVQGEGGGITGRRGAEGDSGGGVIADADAAGGIEAQSRSIERIASAVGYTGGTCGKAGSGGRNIAVARY